MIALPLPDWFGDWPKGLRPSRLSAVDDALCLFFDRGAGPTIEIRVGADASVSPKVVRPSTIGKTERALLLAVRDRIDPRVRAYAQLAVDLVAWRRRAAEGALGLQATQLDSALTLLEQPAFAPEQPDAEILAEAARTLVEWSPAGAAAAAVLRLDVGDIGGAIDAYDHALAGQSGCDSASVACCAASYAACAAVLDGFCGLAVDVRPRVLALADAPLGLEQQRALTRMLTVVEALDAALELRHLVALRTGAAADWREVGRLAALARRPDIARDACTAVLAAEPNGEDLTHAVESVFGAGDPDGALQRARAIHDRGGPLDLSLRLAELELYKGNAEASLPLCELVLAKRPGDLRAIRARGAARTLIGQIEGALEDLDRVIEAEPKNSEALLWRAVARRDAGDTEGMFDDLKPGGRFADHPVWQLQRKQADLVYRADDNEEPWSKSPSHLSLLVQMHGRDAVRPIVDDDRRLSELVDRTMSGFAGNRSRQPTRVVDDRLDPLYDLEAPRSQAVNAQARILHRSVADVLADLAALAAQDEFSPFARTYAAEIHLWMGDYAKAQAGFDEIWDKTKTRWGYVGGGAARMLQGDYDEALAVWGNGKTEYTYLPEEATYAYRGELHWRRGELDLALTDLEHATRENPARMGAWVVRGLAELDGGDERGGLSAFDAIERTLPVLLWEGRRRADVELRGSLGSADRRTVLVACLDMLGGNRASSIYTFRDVNGRFRALGTAQLRVWRDIAQHSRVFARDGVVSHLLAGLSNPK